MEPTNNQIELGCLGALNATLQINGTAAHSARPWVGKNPIYDISKVTEVVLENEILDLNIEGLTYKQVLSITKLADQFLQFIKESENLDLESASEYLLMATWLAYLKSKLLLPSTPEEEFKVQEVADKLKLQLKKLELIRLLSDQMLKRKRLGREIRLRGIKGNIRSIYSTEYRVNL